MIEVLDRVPRYPNRKKITPENGTSYFATVEYADDPIAEGTHVNKALFDAIQKYAWDIGDIKQSVRDLEQTGEYLLCDGRTIEIANYPDMDTIRQAGYVWTSQSGLSGTCKSITYGNGLFVAVGANSACYVSPDGINWTRRSGLSGTFNAITYGNGMFVIVGSNGACYTSDGSYYALPDLGYGYYFKAVR